MIDAIESTSLAMSIDMAKLQVMGQNIANTASPGYRALTPIVHSVSSGSETFDAHLAVPAVVATAVDPRPGALNATGRQLDFAIEGPGYFRLETPEGPRWTRRGVFRLDADGRIVSEQGWALTTQGGEVRLKSESVELDANGQLIQEGVVVGRLSVYDLSASNDLLYEGSGLYAASDSTAAEILPPASSVRQGFLEASNVDQLTEMTRMMEAVRHLQLLGRALQARDSLLQVGINDAGRI